MATSNLEFRTRIEIGGKNTYVPPNREIGVNPNDEFAVRDSQPETAIELNVKGLTENPPGKNLPPFPAEGRGRDQRLVVGNGTGLTGGFGGAQAVTGADHKLARIVYHLTRYRHVSA